MEENTSSERTTKVKKREVNFVRFLHPVQIGGPVYETLSTKGHKAKIEVLPFGVEITVPDQATGKSISFLVYQSNVKQVNYAD